MKLKTECAPLDDLLGGGLEPGTITLIYGEAGAGKTNICLQLARNAILADHGKVAYLDTEGVSMERLEQITGKNLPRVLKGLLFYHPTSLAEQERMTASLEKIKGAGLIVIDSLNMYYRLQLKGGSEEASRSLTTMLGTLLRISRTQNTPVLITGQVFTDEETVRPFGGRIMEHIVKTIVRLERKGPGVRRAILLKHRSQPEGSSAEFALTQDGLGPVRNPS
ncbi:MAG TPA: DNA repair and recombination protein RadB [Candidatus Thermoplasmatota archaeon]|nr:DNA repair and recombination protein RadB [Candidatus Thermoplasmatota archaeon]